MSERFDYDGLLEVNAQLREQNRVLREALVAVVGYPLSIAPLITALKESGQRFHRPAIPVEDLEQAQAALTASSQKGQHG